MLTTCVGLANPGGTISRFGVSAAGSLTEVDLIGPVTVPANDEHHLTDLHVGVAKGAAGTRFGLHYRTSSAASWVQLDETPIGDYGSHVVTWGTSHKIKAGEDWKVTLIQTTVARASARMAGQAKISDSRS